MRALLKSLIHWPFLDFKLLAVLCRAFLREGALAVGKRTSHVVGTRAGRAGDIYVAAILALGFAIRRAYDRWFR